MATTQNVNALIDSLLGGNASVIPILQDAILEGVSDAPKSLRFHVVERAAWTRGGIKYPAERVHGEFAIVDTKAKTIRIFGVKYSGTEAQRAFDRTFAVGDHVEYDSFNLSYYGPVTAIGPSGSVTVQKSYSTRTVRLALASFVSRNWDLDLAAGEARNHEVGMYL